MIFAVVIQIQTSSNYKAIPGTLSATHDILKILYLNCKADTRIIICALISCCDFVARRTFISSYKSQCCMTHCILNGINYTLMILSIFLRYSRAIFVVQEILRTN